MSDHNRQTNPLLLIIVILLCLSSGFFLRQSSYDPDYFTKESVTSRKSDKASSAKDSKEKNTTQNSDKKKTLKKTPSVTPKATQKPTETPTVSDDSNISPEASEGTWTASGSNWLFLVDEQPYTGWLTDIMQTGTITVDGETYELQTDGSLKK